jgi:hypothetical protein
MSPLECEPGVAETSGELVELGKSDTETFLNLCNVKRYLNLLAFQMRTPALSPA